MPHRELMLKLKIFDTQAYRLEYWSKRFGKTKSEQATEFLSLGMNLMTKGFEETHPELLRGEMDYIEKVRWDNRLPHEVAWQYAQHPGGKFANRGLPKTIRKGISPKLEKVIGGEQNG